METKKETTAFTADRLKWLVVLLLLAAGVWANYHFSEVAVALRVAGWIILACIVGLIGFTTTKGKEIWNFAKDSRAELRKVYWPSRQETVQTTMVVIGLVVLMALILWGIDSLFTWGISWLSV